MAHTSELLDFTVNAFIVKDKKILLIFNKTYNSWLGPGGHIEKDEDIISALFREIEEETGIKKENLTIISKNTPIISENIFSDMEGEVQENPFSIDLHRVSDSHQHIAFRYFLKTDRDFIASVDKNVIKHKWFTKGELDNPKYNLRKHLIYYGHKAIELAR